MAQALEPGARVRVRDDYPVLGHIRTPVYVRGKEGVVTKALGKFPNPESLALGRDGLPGQSALRGQLPAIGALARLQRPRNRYAA